MSFKNGQCYVFLGCLGEWRCYLYGANTLIAAFGREGNYVVECPAWSAEASKDVAIFAPLKQICVERGILGKDGFRPHP